MPRLGPAHHHQRARAVRTTRVVPGRCFGNLARAARPADCRDPGASLGRCSTATERVRFVIVEELPQDAGHRREFGGERPVAGRARMYRCRPVALSISSVLRVGSWTGSRSVARSSSSTCRRVRHPKADATCICKHACMCEADRGRSVVRILDYDSGFAGAVLGGAGLGLGLVPDHFVGGLRQKWPQLPLASGRRCREQLASDASPFKS